MFSLICSLGVASSAFNSVSYVDYGSFPTIETVRYCTYSDDLFDLGYCGFNYAPELTSFVLMLKDKYNLNSCIETGTFKGDTTIVFSRIFNKVDTIEINSSFLEFAKIKLNRQKNITFHLGNSKEILETILPSLKNSRPFFYLDAHWNEFWPLLDEIKIIGKYFKDNCIIVIDDFKVPYRNDISFDKYGDHECSMEYIKDSLPEVFSSYDLIFLIPKSQSSKAKAVLIPTSWNNPT